MSRLLDIHALTSFEARMLLRVKTKPVAIFNVYPSKYARRGTSLCARVYLWPTRRSCCRAIEASRQTVASAIGITLRDCRKGQRDKLNPLFAMVHFPINYIGSGIVSHELAHATARYCERRRKKLGKERLRRNLITRDSTEEIFCIALGYMVHDFWKVWYLESLAKFVIKQTPRSRRRAPSNTNR